MSDDGHSSRHGHRGTYATPVHTAERATRVSETVIHPRSPVVEYSRGFNKLPYAVIHDAIAPPPLGIYRVYLGPTQIGTQLSYPSADDCRRMELVPPPLHFATTRNLTGSQRRARGLPLNAHHEKGRAWRTPKKARK
mgnify:FL=1